MELKSSGKGAVKSPMGVYKKEEGRTLEADTQEDQSVALPCPCNPARSSTCPQRALEQLKVQSYVPQLSREKRAPAPARRGHWTNSMSSRMCRSCAGRSTLHATAETQPPSLQDLSGMQGRRSLSPACPPERCCRRGVGAGKTQGANSLLSSYHVAVAPQNLV
jgi:hypothetical protein